MDNVRVAVIAGVIVFHVATSYAIHMGWYYQEWTENDFTEAVLSVLLGSGALFGLALLFLVSGMLSSVSLARKGFRRFARDRLVRLGIPLVAYWLVIDPLTELVAQRAYGTPAARRPASLIVDTIATFETGVMWFVAALLVFSLGYAGWRHVRPATATAGRVLGWRHLLVAWIVIVVGSFALRLVWALGDDTPLTLNLWEWPQMATLFALGTLAGERGWLDPFPAAIRRRSGRAAIAGWAGAMLVIPAWVAADETDNFVGGLHFEALGMPLVEATLALGMSLWLVGWLPGHLGRRGPLARALGRASYATYVIHPLVIVSMSAALSSVPVVIEIKFVVVAALGLVASFTIGWLLTRIRPLSRIL